MFGLFRKKADTPAAADLPQSRTPLAPRSVLDSIVPVVKAIEFAGASGNEVDLPQDEMPIGRAFVADLMILYAEDKPDQFEFISSRRLREIGLTEEELHLRALINLPSRPPKIEVRGAPPRQMIVAGGNFEATLLLYDGLWNEIGKRISGDLLAVAPARDLLLISDSSWSGARDFLKGVAETELEDKRRALSKCILKRAQGKWIADDLAS